MWLFDVFYDKESQTLRECKYTLTHVYVILIKIKLSH